MWDRKGEGERWCAMRYLLRRRKLRCIRWHRMVSVGGRGASWALLLLCDIGLPLRLWMRMLGNGLRASTGHVVRILVRILRDLLHLWRRLSPWLRSSLRRLGTGSIGHVMRRDMLLLHQWHGVAELLLLRPVRWHGSCTRWWRGVHRREGWLLHRWRKAAHGHGLSMRGQSCS